MGNQSEMEKRLSEIKWCAQKLCELIKLEPSITRFANAYQAIDSSLLCDLIFKNIEAKPPVIENEDRE